MANNLYLNKHKKTESMRTLGFQRKVISYSLPVEEVTTVESGSVTLFDSAV